MNGVSGNQFQIDKPAILTNLSVFGFSKEIFSCKYSLKLKGMQQNGIKNLFNLVP